MFGRDTCYVTTIGLSQIAGAQFLHVYKPAQLDQLRPGRPARLDLARGPRACAPPIPSRKIVALSGDYDFQFMLEELAVGAQHKLPYLHVVVNNSYLGLDPPGAARLPDGFRGQPGLRQHQRGAGRRRGAGLRRGPRGGRRGARLQGGPGEEPERVQGRLRPGRGPDGRAPGAGGVGVHPRTGDQHLHGYRGRQRQRVRGHPLPRPVTVDPDRSQDMGASDTAAARRCSPPAESGRRRRHPCPNSPPI